MITEKLSIEELNCLCEAYLECRLSRLQEKELEYVLSASDASTPAIDEARLSMRIETARQSMPVRHTRRRPWFKWMSAAAAVAVMAVITVSYLDYRSENYLKVYVNGVELRGGEARMAAAEIERDCMAEMKRMMTESQQINSENINTLKSAIR